MSCGANAAGSTCSFESGIQRASLQTVDIGHDFASDIGRSTAVGLKHPSVAVAAVWHWDPVLDCIRLRIQHDDFVGRITCSPHLLTIGRDHNMIVAEAVGLKRA